MQYKIYFQFTAKTGDEIYFPKHIPHAFQNTGSKAGKTIWTVVPGGNFEEFFDKLGLLPPGEPDLKVVGGIFAEHGMKILVPEKCVIEFNHSAGEIIAC